MAASASSLRYHLLSGNEFLYQKKKNRFMHTLLYGTWHCHNVGINTEHCRACYCVLDNTSLSPFEIAVSSEFD